MSQTTHPAENTKKTLWSYVIGFVLSLVFTIDAYLLVTSKSVTASALFAVLLTLALLQMMVQIFFFLHLGRGPKPLYNVAFFIGTVGIIVVVIVGPYLL